MASVVSLVSKISEGKEILLARFRDIDPAATEEYLIVFCKALGILTVGAASFFISKKDTLGTRVVTLVKIGIAAGILAWAMPRLVDVAYQKTIRYDLLLQYGILESDLQKYEQEATRNEFSAFVSFLEKVTETMIGELKFTRVWPRLLPLLQKCIEQNRISAQLLGKLKSAFRKHRIFHAGNINREVRLVSAEGKVFRANKTLLMMASPNLKAMLTANMAEKQNGEIKLPKYPSRMIESFLLFLQEGAIAQDLNFDQCAYLYDFSRAYLIVDLQEKAAFRLLNLASQSNDQKKLLNFLEILSPYFTPSSDDQSVVLEEDLFPILIAHAFTAYFRSQRSYANFKTCCLTQERLTIPIQELYLTKEETLIGEALSRYVNCVTLDDPDIDLTSKLQLFQETIPESIKKQITAVEIVCSPSILQEVHKNNIVAILKLFPNAKTIYFSTGRFQVFRDHCYWSKEFLLPLLEQFQKEEKEAVLAFHNFPSTPTSKNFAIIKESDKVCGSEELKQIFEKSTFLLFDTFNLYWTESRDFPPEVKTLLKQKKRRATSGIIHQIFFRNYVYTD